MKPRKLVPLSLAFCLILLISSTQGIEAQTTLPPEESPAHARYGSIDASEPANPMPEALEASLTEKGLLSPRPVPQATPGGYPGAVYFSHMVFQSYYNDQWEIRRGNPDTIYASTFDLGPVIEYPGSDTQPRLNHGASRLAFVSTRFGTSEILSANIDGNNTQRLTNNPVPDAQPDWSPDNRQIVFVSQRSGYQDIYLMNADGSNQRPLFFDAVTDFDPSWSPDGGRIAFASAVDTQRGQIWITNLDGSDALPVTPPLLYVGNPVWSPDGAMLGLDYDADSDGFNEVAVMNADGSDLRVLPGQEHNSLFNMDITMSTWMPDSRSVVMSNLMWFFYQGSWYLTQTSMTYKNIYDTDLPRDFYQIYDSMSPDIGPYDITPPASTVKPLPEYSRASGFMVQWNAADDFSDIWSANLQEKSTSGWTDIDWRESYTISGETWDNLLTRRGGFPPGTKLYYRTQSQDWAENAEPYPNGDGDAWTTTFNTWFKAAILDVREAPVIKAVRAAPGAINSFSPSLDNRFDAYYGNTGLTTLSVDQPKYGTLPGASLRLDRDIEWKFILPPLDNLIQNGDFESGAGGLDGWETAGMLPETNAQAYSGTASLRMGKDCLNGCFTTPENIPPGITVENIAVDSQGGVHAIGLGKYTQRLNGGGWSQVFELAPNTGYYPSWLTMGKDDVLHAVVSSPEGSWYMSKAPGGEWSVAEPLPAGISLSTNFDFRVLQNGEVVFAVDNSMLTTTLSVIRRLLDGGWAVNTLPFYRIDGGSEDIKIGPEGSLHIVGWNRQGVYYDEYLPDGTLLPRVNLGVTDGHNLSIHMDEDQGLHLIYGNLYSYRNPHKEWSAPIVLAPNGTIYSIVVAPDNGLWVNFNPNSFAHRAGWGGSFEPADPQVTGNQLLVDGEIDDSGIFHQVLDNNGGRVYLRSTTAEETQTATIRQTIQIPAMMHKPTLSFNYKILAHTQQKDSGLFVEITPAAGITQKVFSSNGPAGGWQHAWVDLSPWSGQDVSVSFTFTQTSGDAEAGVLLDNISAGSWLTPVVQSITPNEMRCPTTAATALTIVGENYIPGVEVSLNGQPAVIEYINENKLILTLPAGTGCGLYDVLITNPQGHQAALPGGLNLFNKFFLPLMTN